jgi:PhnB protein
MSTAVNQTFRLHSTAVRLLWQARSGVANIVPYLSFGGNCREAMTFYKECLGGDLTMQTMGESPMGAQAPAGDKNKIMHVASKKDGLEIMASDMMGPGSAVYGNTINLMIACTSEQEINSYFSKLSKGGKAGHALKEEFWGDVFGDLTDKFGIRWMLNWSKPKK